MGASRSAGRRGTGNRLRNVIIGCSGRPTCSTPRDTSSSCLRGPSCLCEKLPNQGRAQRGAQGPCRRRLGVLGVCPWRPCREPTSVSGGDDTHDVVLDLVGDATDRRDFAGMGRLPLRGPCFERVQSRCQRRMRRDVAACRSHARFVVRKSASLREPRRRPSPEKPAWATLGRSVRDPTASGARGSATL